MRAAISRTVTGIFTSPWLRSMRRIWYGMGRTLGGPAIVHYFHQPDDPYSQLAIQLLRPLEEKYRVTIRTHLVSAPDEAAAPEPEKLSALADADARILAKAYGLKYPAPGSIVTGAAPTIEGDRLRRLLGHYLSAMFYFEGEWYWGVDRFHFLQERLHAAGLSKSGDAMIPLAPAREVECPGPARTGSRATIDFFLSFRSPYTYLAVPRVRRLAKHYGADLRLRFVLPMVMRGLPVPVTKRMYITLDTKREAERLGMPFGRIVDPVGRPTERGLAVLHHAIKAGKGQEFAESFLSGVFAEGIDAGDDGELRMLAARAGIDATAVDAALRDPSWRDVAEANRTELFSLGLWGVPCFRVNENRPHWGQDRLWVIEQELLDAK